MASACVLRFSYRRCEWREMEDFIDSFWPLLNYFGLLTLDPLTSKDELLS